MFSHKVRDDVALRILETRHAEDLFSLIAENRECLRKWLPWVDGTTRPEQTRNRIEISLKAFAENNGFQLGVFHKGSIAGCIGLHSIDWNNRKTSIGYWLGEAFQGRGIMTDSCKAVVDYLFKDLSLNRVEIRAAPANLKSRAVPERLKFVNEGTVRQAEWLYDHYVDHVVYGMLKEDWQ
ncbi:MAG TPA: GNAT family protein [Selenomonadales bacterium]|nr:GNAT family protein [Selenomonadales bacterium]